jgi:hypothetical protein
MNGFVRISHDMCAAIIYGIYNPFHCPVYKYPLKSKRIITYMSCCQVNFCTPIRLLIYPSTFAFYKNPFNRSYKQPMSYRMMERQGRIAMSVSYIRLTEF